MEREEGCTGKMDKRGERKIRLRNMLVFGLFLNGGIGSWRIRVCLSRFTYFFVLVWLRRSDFMLLTVTIIRSL